MIRMRVSLDKAYMEKSQYHLPKFRVQIDYEYPPWVLVLIVDFCSV